MDLTSGFLFSISVCILVLFWNNVVSMRAISKAVPHCFDSSFVTFVHPSFTFPHTTCQKKASGAAPFCSEERVGFVSAELSASPAEEQLVLGTGFPQVLQISETHLRRRAERHRISREGVVERLQNKVMLKRCGQHSNLVVDQCRTTASGTSIQWLRTHRW